MPNNKMPGIYQGEYQIKKPTVSGFEKCAGYGTPIRQAARSPKESKNWISMFGATGTGYRCYQRTALAFLLFGLGDDRPGGAKIGYLDSMVMLKVTGKVGNKCVQLSNTALRLLKTTRWSSRPEPIRLNRSQAAGLFYGDDKFDYV